MEDVLRQERKKRVAAEKLTPRYQFVRQMAQRKIIRKDREVTGLGERCRRRGYQINAIQEIAERRIQNALRTCKKPLRILTYMISIETIVTQALGRG